MDEALKKLQGAINEASLKKEKGYQFKIAMYKKGISAIKAFPELKPENAIKMRFKNPDGILKKLQRDYKPIPFTNIHGFGPKLASNLVAKGVSNIPSLKARPNLMNKLTTTQKTAINFHSNAIQKIPRKDIVEFEKKIKNISNKCEVIIAGSYRRGAAESGDIDVILVCENDSVQEYKNFIKECINKNILHEKHLSFGNKKWLGYGKTANKFSRIDILLTPRKELPFALLYFTGSGDFNEQMRAFVKTKGYSLSETGIKGVSSTFKEEKDIFQFFGLEYVKPEDRKFFQMPKKASTFLEKKQRRKAMLAVETKPDKVTNYFMSEKLNGIRALWNGKNLYSRTGKEFSAPKWFLNSLPKMNLDGELYLGPGKFEETQSIIMKKVPDNDEWKKVKYMIFDAPSNKPFNKRYENFKNLPNAVRHTVISSKNQLNNFYNKIIKKKGEGVMLRKIDSPYEEKRSRFLIKLKPKRNAEAIVIGVQKGKGKYKNAMGALIVRDKNTNVEFKIGSGFNDAQRKESWKPGNVVTYVYRDKTAKGVPRFGTFKARRLQ